MTTTTKSGTEVLFTLSNLIQDELDGMEGTDALAVLAALRVEVEHLVDRNARRSRKAGVTYAAIGSALGVSRQAAQQRWP